MNQNQSTTRIVVHSQFAGEYFSEQIFLGSILCIILQKFNQENDTIETGRTTDTATTHARQIGKAMKRRGYWTEWRTENSMATMLTRKVSHRGHNEQMEKNWHVAFKVPSTADMNH
jgi:hypothetical protein